MSAITLNFPDRCSPANFADSFIWIRTANARTRFAETREELDLILYSHATAGRLSHQIAADAKRNSSGEIAASNTSQCSNTPASLSSEMLMEPEGLVSVRKCRVNCDGHSKN